MRRRDCHRVKKFFQLAAAAKTAEKAASGQEFKAWLADDVSEIDWDSAGQIERLGVTAGASAPDYLVDELLAEARRRYPNLKIWYVTVTAETKIP